MKFIKGFYPKFRVSTGKKLSGDVNPIKYDIIDCNHEIEYNNGVVLIIRPGWYTFSANIRGDDSMRADQFTNFWIAINQSHESHGGTWVDFLTDKMCMAAYFNYLHFSPGRGHSTTQYTGYFKQFDMVHTRVITTVSRGHKHDQWFEGRMIP